MSQENLQTMVMQNFGGKRGVLWDCASSEYKMLEHDWFLTALIYGLIGCFRPKLSDLTCPITTIL